MQFYVCFMVSVVVMGVAGVYVAFTPEALGHVDVSDMLSAAMMGVMLVGGLPAVLKGDKSRRYYLR